MMSGCFALRRQSGLLQLFFYCNKLSLRRERNRIHFVQNTQKMKSVKKKKLLCEGQMSVIHGHLDRCKCLHFNALK